LRNQIYSGTLTRTVSARIGDAFMNSDEEQVKLLAVSWFVRR
jgi:hypothetical protein